MTEKIPARFRKTKTEKWAVMAPMADLEAALAAGGKVDVQKKNGDWSTFTVGSLGGAFDVDGVQMCYGYAPGDDNPPQGSSSPGTGAKKSAPIDLREDQQSQNQTSPLHRRRMILSRCLTSKVTTTTSGSSPSSSAQAVTGWPGLSGRTI